jgi:hypothetical protein
VRAELAFGVGGHLGFSRPKRGGERKSCGEQRE